MPQPTTSMTWPEVQIRRFLTTRPGIWFGRYILPYLDRPLLALSHGRYSMSPGQPVLLLFTAGARTGRRRATPMLYFRDRGRLIVVASNGGRSFHPGWCYNLRAHPEATAYVGGEVIRCVAREAQEAERARLWQKAVNYFDGFTLYAQNATRTIPIFILEPCKQDSL